jgi:hypothetical protein
MSSMSGVTGDRIPPGRLADMECAAAKAGNPSRRWRTGQYRIIRMPAVYGCGRVGSQPRRSHAAAGKCGEFRPSGPCRTGRAPAFGTVDRQAAAGGADRTRRWCRAAVGEIALASNEYKAVERLKADYWLYAVGDCATAPKVHPAQDPPRLSWAPIIKIGHCHMGAELILAASTGKP